jgi:hypothetical protein
MCPPKFSILTVSNNGEQVLLSFIITAGISLLLSAVLILREIRRSFHESKVIRKLLLSFSDQQVITGIGIQCVGLAKMEFMVPYHFFIIWMLSLLSTATHIGTLLALVQDFKRDWVLRWIRQFFMFVNLVLSCVSGIFLLMSTLRNLSQTLPIACVWQVKSNGAASNSTISVIGTIAVISGNCIMFVLGFWYLHVKERPWLKTIQILGLFMSAAIAVGAAVRVILLSQAFGKPSVSLRDAGERDWSFGQLLPMLLLLLPLVSAVEIMRGMLEDLAAWFTPANLVFVGEMRVPSIKDDEISLIESHPNKDGGQSSFQPNPFWGGSGAAASRWSK